MTQDGIYIREEEKGDGSVWASIALKNSNELNTSYVEFQSLVDAAKYLLERTNWNGQVLMKANERQKGQAIGILLLAGIDTGLHLLEEKWVWSWQIPCRVIP